MRRCDANESTGGVSMRVHVLVLYNAASTFLGATYSTAGNAYHCWLLGHMLIEPEWTLA